MYQDGIKLINEKYGPKRPQYRNELLNIRQTLPDLIKPITNKPDPKIEKYGDHWELIIDFGKILPRAKLWSTGIIYISADYSQKINIFASIYAENLPNPIPISLSVQIKTEKRPMERTDMRIAHPRLSN